MPDNELSRDQWLLELDGPLAEAVKMSRTTRELLPDTASEELRFAMNRLQSMLEDLQREFQKALAVPRR